MSEVHFHCSNECGQQLDLDVVLPPYEHAGHYAAVLAGEVRAAGWVVTDVEVCACGHPHVRVRCSVECHNRHAQKWFDDRQRRHQYWWGDIHEFDGSIPPCTCTLEPDDEGLLCHVRDADCTWCSWLDRWSRDRDDTQRRLYEQWLDVPVGTLVEDRNNYGKRRGRGRTVGAPRLCLHCDGSPYTLVPVDDWRPHPHLDDLVLMDHQFRRR